MSNIELYCKVQNVVMSCTNEKQFEVAKRYAKLAEDQLSHEWCMDIIKMVVSKERQLAERV
jgi:hypothetical protein